MTQWETAHSRAVTHHVNLNKMFVKYGFFTRERKIHMLAQIYIETGLLRLMREGGQGAPNSAIPKAQHYAAFYGTGYMQLTWMKNYTGYGDYRGFASNQSSYIDPRITPTSTHVWQDFDPPASPIMRRWAPRYDPEILVTDLYSAADSGGYYWSTKSFAGKKNINRPCDIGLGSYVVGYVSILVNGGGNGYEHRQGFVPFLKNVLLDAHPKTGNEVIRYTRMSTLMQHFIIALVYPPTPQAETETTRIYYDAQIP